VVLGPTVAQNLLFALSDLASAQDAFMSVWIGYQAAKMRLYRELGLMQLDQNGLWIETPIFAAERASAEDEPLPPPVPADWLEGEPLPPDVPGAPPIPDVPPASDMGRARVEQMGVGGQLRAGRHRVPHTSDVETGRSSESAGRATVPAGHESEAAEPGERKRFDQLIELLGI
jgi:hypothetical protein